MFRGAIFNQASPNVRLKMQWAVVARRTLVAALVSSWESLQLSYRARYLTCESEKNREGWSRNDHHIHQPLRYPVWGGRPTSRGLTAFKNDGGLPVHVQFERGTSKFNKHRHTNSIISLHANQPLDVIHS